MLLVASRPVVRLPNARHYTILFNKLVDHWYNRYNVATVEKLGPQRACAEWLIRCAAAFRTRDDCQWISRRKQLRKMAEDFSIEEIDFTDSCVSFPGFDHLKSLTSVKRVQLHQCSWLDDNAVAKLSFHLQDCLEVVDMAHCGYVSAGGVAQLQNLKKVKVIKLQTLPLIADHQKAVVLSVLQIKLGNRCRVEYLND